MTRGNQRDQDRAKNLKKQAESKKGTNLPEGMTLQQKKDQDAEIMRKKQLLASQVKNDSQSVKSTIK